MPRLRRWKPMTRTSKIILRRLCGLAVCIVIAVAAFVVWRENLAHDVDAKLQAIRSDDDGLGKSDQKESADKTTYDITFTVER
jgi:hypothetical protein